MRTQKPQKSDKNFVPSSYEELYRHYIEDDNRGLSLCSILIRKMMPYSTPDERETLKHDVFVRLMDKQMLAKYDPTKANFGGVIFFTTRTVVTHHLAQKGRNPITGLCGGSLIEDTGDSETFEPGVYSLDRLFGGLEEDREAVMDARDLVAQLFAWAKTLHDAPRHKRDASLYPLLQMMAEEKDPKDCAPSLGVTPSTIFNWIVVLRDKLTELKAQAEAT